MVAQARIAVIYYSTYGHITKLTEEIVAGAKSTGAHVDLLQIPETLSDEILAKQHAIPRPDEAKVPKANPDSLADYDGFIFGFPTRYGRAPAQVSSFFDATGKLWSTGALVGKFATVYTSAASQHGGLETTQLTTMPFFIHHGISYVPSGFASSELTKLDEIIGGSAYGAGTIAGGDGSRQPTTADLAVAKAQGVHFSKIVGTFVAGKAALARQESNNTMFAAEAVPTSGDPVNMYPVQATSEAKPYQVDAPASDNPPSAPVGNAAPTNTVSTAAVPPVAAAPINEKSIVPASNVGSTPAATSAAPKKKPSIFARCCGSEKDYAK